MLLVPTKLSIWRSCLSPIENESLSWSLTHEGRMSDAPWTITSSKRKPSTRVASPKKRIKHKHDATTTGQDGAFSRPQQTLTQIAFVTNPSSDNEEPLIDFEPLRTGLSKPTTNEPPRLLSRDSTLTQMDFGSSFSSPIERQSSSMRPPARKTRRKSKKRESTLTQMDFFNANMDGAAELEETMLSSPPVPSEEPLTTATSFASPGKTITTPVHEHPQVDVVYPGTQNYRSRKRKRGNEQAQLDSEKRRRSSRIAAAATTPTATTTSVKPGRIQPPSACRRAPTTISRKPLLEIQDSTEFLEEPVDSAVSPQPAGAIAPSTPTKNIGRIPSSQTPETIRCITPGRAVSLTKGSSRQPLAELSSNLRMPGQKFAQSKIRTIDLFSETNIKKSPPRTICTLKVLKRAPASVGEVHRAEDPEHDIYSLQATSSPTRRGGSSQNELSDLPELSKRASSSIGGPTIKETASSQRMVESQNSLPDINDVLGLRPVAAADGAAEAQLRDPARPTKVQRNPTSGGDGRTVDQSEMLLGQEPVNMIPELESVSTDEMSDFGSPVANDTQFIRSLRDRLSSPVAVTAVATSSIEGNRAVTVPRTSNRSPILARGLSRGSLPGSPPRRSPLPAPKLVHTSPARRPPPQATGSSSLRALPSFSTQNRSSENVQISLVPLNDTVEHHQSSSSPALPPAPLSSAAKGEHLASIPHPSQVSTQVPSQGYFPTSSAPHTFPFPHDSEVERVTVKDPSSFPAHLSQIMQHVDDGSESEGDLNLLEDLQDEDDLDLDPSTVPVDVLRTKKENIHGGTTFEEDVTQTPTQKSRYRKSPVAAHSSTQSSPIITNATTRSQRNAKLEVIPLTSSSSPLRPQRPSDNGNTPKPQKSTPAKYASPKGKERVNEPPSQTSPPSSSLSSSIYSPSPPRDLKRKYSPIPGFNNETQSDFTQNGSVTAAYVHRMWDKGDLPKSFVPKPYKVKNFHPSLRKDGRSKRGK